MPAVAQGSLTGQLWNLLACWKAHAIVEPSQMLRAT